MLFRCFSLTEVELPTIKQTDSEDEADAASEARSDDTDATIETVETVDDELLERIKKVLEDEDLSDISASERLHESASCLVRERPWLSRGVRHMLKETNQLFGMADEAKLALELNMSHPLVQRLREVEGEQFDDLVRTLLDQARLAYGSLDVDTAAYVRRVNGILTDLLGKAA